MTTVTVKPDDEITDAPLSEHDLRAVRHKITQAKAQLVIRQPFYASLILQRPLIETYGVPTAGADAKARIYYNPKFIASKDVGEVQKIVFLMAHEVLHIAFNHCHKDVMGERNPRACNIAMDKVINELLIKDQVGEFIQGGQRHAGAENMKWQDLYQEDDGNGGSGGIGDDLVDCPDGEPNSTEREQLKERIKVEVAQAAQAAKMQGKLSANLQRVVDELIHVKTPWFDILSRFMDQFVASDYSWTRPNRRFVGRGLYLPGLNKTPTMGRLAVVVDTSGSIGQHELNLFASHMNRIIEQCLPEAVTVVYCDADVAHVDEYEISDYPIKLSPYGGGGTDLRRGLQWIDDSGEEYTCVVVFSDLYTPFPETVNRPTIWLSTTDQVAPESCGETVKYEE